MAEFPTSDAGVRALRAELLGELAASTYPKESIGLIARNHQLTVEDVRALVGNYGYPDKKEMRRHLFELGVSTPPPTPAPALAPRPAPTADSTNAIERLLAEGGKSQRARTKNLAEKINTLLGDLRELVLTERKETAAAVAALAERTRLKAEVDALEAQLAEKKALLKPAAKKAAAAPAPSTDNKAIREWAAKHSVACTAFGRVPRDVVEAYEVATRGAA
jgi:hypothetical protein